MSIEQKRKKILEDYILENKEKFYHIAYSYTQNKEDAFDIIQESIYKAFKMVSSLKQPEYIKTWFYKILIHTAVDLIRKNKKYILLDEPYMTVEKSYCDRYEDIDLKKILDNLPHEQRTIIILRYFEDLKLQEIADILNENLSTVKNRLYKALKNLKFEISAQEVIENERERKVKSIKDRVQ